MASCDLFSPYEELPVPDYLENDEEKEFFNQQKCSVLKMWTSRQEIESLNKHEVLFGYSKSARYIPAGLLQIVQFTLTICVAWSIMSILSELFAVTSLLGDTAASAEIPLRLLLPLIHVNLLVVAYKIYKEWMPNTLLTYTLCTSTEMMKERSLIEKTVQEQKTEKNERNYRVFQAMRLMRREYMKNLFVDTLSEDGSLSNSDQE